MNEILTVHDRVARSRVFESMHADRKRVFVDWLGWDVPHHAGFEIDEYDNDRAVYIVVLNEATGKHLGSVRILPTDGAHILGDLFPSLCADGPPRNPLVKEITRLCVSPGCPAEKRLGVRRELLSALARYALSAGLIGYTAVTDVSFMSRVAGAGWKCYPLGLPQIADGEGLAALFIEIDGDTIEALRQAGTYIEQPAARQAAVATSA